MLGALAVLAGLVAQDPVEVSARLWDTEIRAGETTVLRVEVETGGERARIDRFRTLPPGIELAGTRDYDQRQFRLPGGGSRLVAREFVLRGRAPGRYLIPSIEVVVDGRTYSTGTSLLTVAPAPGYGELPGGATADVVLRARLDRDTVYVGEQVTLEVDALFSQDARLRLRRAPQYEAPSPSGFWIHDLGGAGRSSTHITGGHVYEVQTFRRAFFPIEPGGHTIPPALLEYEIRRGLFSAPETLRAESEPLPLVVLPVPEAGRPPAFTGAVGSFTVRGTLEPAAVPVGEAAVLTLEVEGAGNVKALPAPRLPPVPGAEVFPPTEQTDLTVQEGEVRGIKRFSWVLIPREPGPLDLPPIPYPYFDPLEGRFEVAQPPPLTLLVEPGSGAAVAAAGDDGPALRYLKGAPAPADPFGFTRSPVFLAFQAVPLLLFAGALVLRRRGRRDRRLSRAALRRGREAGIRALETALDDADPTLFGRAETFARGWLATRLGLSRAEVGDGPALIAAGVREETATSLTRLLRDLAAARYAPDRPGPSTRRALVRALAALLERVDQEAPFPDSGTPPTPDAPAATGAAAYPLVALALALASVPGARPAAADPVTERAVSTGPVHATGAALEESAFSEGLRRFDAGLYGEAASAFQRHVDARPADPAGWYNLGTSLHRAGETGPAVRAWLRGLRIAPRDDDILHNLRAAGVAPELIARVSPTVPLRSGEALLLAAAAWLLAGVAGAVWTLRRRRGSAIAAVLGLVVTVAALGAARDAGRDPDTLILLGPSSLRAGPNLHAETVAELPAGAGLVPLHRRGDWVRARTLDGADGWIEAAEAATL